MTELDLELVEPDDGMVSELDKALCGCCCCCCSCCCSCGGGSGGGGGSSSGA